jgi:hypothetical protein
MHPFPPPLPLKQCADVLRSLPPRSLDELRVPACKPFVSPEALAAAAASAANDAEAKRKAATVGSPLASFAAMSPGPSPQRSSFDAARAAAAAAEARMSTFSGMAAPPSPGIADDAAAMQSSPADAAVHQALAQLAGAGFSSKVGRAGWGRAGYPGVSFFSFSVLFFCFLGGGEGGFFCFLGGGRGGRARALAGPKYCHGRLLHPRMAARGWDGVGGLGVVPLSPNCPNPTPAPSTPLFFPPSHIPPPPPSHPMSPPPKHNTPPPPPPGRTPK